jgi:hypothetical protein
VEDEEAALAREHALDENLQALGAGFDGDVGGFDVISLGKEVSTAAGSGQSSFVPFLECIWANRDDADYECV